MIQNSFMIWTVREMLNSHVTRAGLRGDNGGNCPGPPLQGASRDEIYLFQLKYSFEKFS